MCSSRHPQIMGPRNSVKHIEFQARDLHFVDCVLIVDDDSADCDTSEWIIETCSIT